MVAPPARSSLPPSSSSPLPPSSSSCRCRCRSSCRQPRRGRRQRGGSLTRSAVCACFDSKSSPCWSVSQQLSGDSCPHTYRACGSAVGFAESSVRTSSTSHRRCSQGTCPRRARVFEVLVTKIRFQRFAGNPIGNKDPFLPRTCAVCACPTSPKYAKHRALSQTSNYLILPFISQTRTIMYRVRQHQGSCTRPRKSNNPKGVEYTVRVFDFRSGALSWGAQRETLRDHRGALGRQVLPMVRVAKGAVSSEVPQVLPGGGHWRDHGTRLAL